MLRYVIVYHTCAYIMLYHSSEISFATACLTTLAFCAFAPLRAVRLEALIGAEDCTRELPNGLSVVFSSGFPPICDFRCNILPRPEEAGHREAARQSADKRHAGAGGSRRRRGATERTLAADEWGQHSWGRCKRNEF